MTHFRDPFSPPKDFGGAPSPDHVTVGVIKNEGKGVGDTENWHIASTVWLIDLIIHFRCAVCVLAVQVIAAVPQSRHELRTKTNEGTMKFIQ